MLVTQGTIFGAIFSVNKIAATNGIPTVGYAFWQAFAAGIILLILSLAIKRPPAWSIAHLRAYFSIGVLALAIPFMVFAYVAPKIPAGIVTLVITLIPALTYVLALSLRTERLQWTRIAGLTCGIIGVLLVVLPETSLPNPDMAVWVLIALIAPATSALSNVLAERFRPPQTSSLTMACGMLLAAAIVILPIMLLTGQQYMFEATYSGNQALVIAIVISSVNFILFFEIVRRAGAVFFSQFNYVAVLSGIIWGMILFGESHSIWIWAALLVMLLGLTLVNRGVSARS